ncbi:MAG: SulP family inorganic anion transporter [Caryophanon sp.]|nr:SulP family inorganic anion transporter [Caryophanon sp.]
MQTYPQQWFHNIRKDVLAGMVVALALIPEAIAFSILAGVDPMVGLYASFTIAIICAFFGGRPAMISAATGAMALVIVSLVKDHGLQYLLAATILTGIIQIIFGYLKIARLMRFIPNAVMIGFVNSLAILVFMAQLPHFINVTWISYVFVAATIALIYIIPKFIKGIPAPLITVLLLTPLAMYASFNMTTVGDLGTITQSLPTFLLPDVPLNFETLRIILPYALALAVVGLMESLLTAQILDDLTDTMSDKNQEARGQGLANIVNGFFGGMAGCAMIGQSVINVRSGGRGRLSTFVSGAFLMFLIIVLGDYVVAIPMPVLAGIMVTVCIAQFDWSSFRYVRTAPRADVIVMLATVALVVWTHNLAIGVVGGVFISAMFFAAKISTIYIEKNGNTLHIHGQLFFASTDRFVRGIDAMKFENAHVTIDLSNSQLWDDSAVAAIVRVQENLAKTNSTVTLAGVNDSGKALLAKYQISI